MLLLFNGCWDGTPNENSNTTNGNNSTGTEVSSNTDAFTFQGKEPAQTELPPPIIDESSIPQSIVRESEQPAPNVPQFKTGDNVYVSVTGNVPRMVIFLSAVGKDEFNNKGFSKDDGYPDNIIPYDSNIDVRIWTRQGTNREVMRINAKELLDSIVKEIKANPENKKLWFRTWENNRGKIKFEFAGIQRFFRLDSINVPPLSPLQKRTRYEGGTPPLLRLYIDIDGNKPLCFDSNTKGWTSLFSKDNSKFVLREWTEETLVLRLKDINTYGWELDLASIPDVKFADIREGTVYEKIDTFGDPKSRIKLEFREVKEP